MSWLGLFGRAPPKPKPKARRVRPTLDLPLKQPSKQPGQMPDLPLEQPPEQPPEIPASGDAPVSSGVAALPKPEADPAQEQARREWIAFFVRTNQLDRAFALGFKHDQSIVRIQARCRRWLRKHRPHSEMPPPQPAAAVATSISAPIQRACALSGAGRTGGHCAAATEEQPARGFSARAPASARAALGARSAPELERGPRELAPELERARRLAPSASHSHTASLASARAPSRTPALGPARPASSATPATAAGCARSQAHGEPRGSRPPAAKASPLLLPLSLRTGSDAADPTPADARAHSARVALGACVRAERRHDELDRVGAQLERVASALLEAEAATSAGTRALSAVSQAGERAARAGAALEVAAQHGASRLRAGAARAEFAPTGLRLLRAERQLLAAQCAELSRAAAGLSGALEATEDSSADLHACTVALVRVHAGLVRGEERSAPSDVKVQAAVAAAQTASRNCRAATVRALALQRMALEDAGRGSLRVGEVQLAMLH